METQVKDLKINPKLVKDLLVRFIREETEKVGFRKLVVGLSGGVDSALSAALAVEAIGKENVLGVILPYKISSKDSVEDAKLFADKFGIKTEIIDISASADLIINREPSMGNVRKGNILSRTRMTLLYDISAREKALVLGTSNKTELLLGYGTLFGDMAHAINPIGDLYKTQVWQLSEFVGVPEKIVKKKPSADLWVGQTDEAEIGYTYEEIDKVLYLLVDQRMRIEEVISLGHPAKMTNDLYRMMMRSQFKRRPPIIAKVGHRTINVDFRYLRDWGA
ncbi:MAG: NAD+ synthase [Bacteroidetes bacterium]|nr:NAD+ synthase [Bacteroidota bacterium]MCL5737698.1 NAD+ synthase [Bacteroidota bacterium]